MAISLIEVRKGMKVDAWSLFGSELGGAPLSMCYGCNKTYCSPFNMCHHAKTHLASCISLDEGSEKQEAGKAGRLLKIGEKFVCKLCFHEDDTWR